MGEVEIIEAVFFSSWKSNLLSLLAVHRMDLAHNIPFNRAGYSVMDRLAGG
jgi:hypothetical protein